MRPENASFIYRLIVALLLSATSVPGARAQQANTSVSLILSHDQATPGSAITAGVRLEMNDGWHTYWKNPGTSGQATKIDWNLPEGFSAGEIQWPTPERFDTLGIPGFGYHHEVVLLVPISIGEAVPPGSYEIGAEVSWLECEQVCIPGSGTVSGELAVGSSSEASSASATLETWERYIPEASDISGVASWRSKDPEERPFLLVLELEERELEELVFFPSYNENFDTDLDGKVEIQGTQALVRGSVFLYDGEWPEMIEGVLAYSESGVNHRLGLAIAASFGEDDGSGGTAQSDSSQSMLYMILMGILGGFILNFMPCVLPVISLKITSLIKMSGDRPEIARAHGLYYFAGVLASFLLMAGIVIGLKESGRLIGWGAQFGNIYFLVGITVVVTVVALNLFGVFEFNAGSGAMRVAGVASSKTGALGSFLSGVLATTLATACTAPILSLAATFALTKTHFVTVVIFLAMGVGLGAPFLALAARPELRRWLPKPGAWMEKFKIIMGFPVLATALWLLSLVDSSLDGQGGVFWMGMFLVVLSLGFWIWGAFAQRGSGSQRRLGRPIAVFVVLVGYWVTMEWGMDWRQTRPSIEWAEWSPEAVREAQTEGHPVLVDFTAEWCAVCNGNKRRSIEVESVMRRLNELNVVTLKADYTNTPEHMTKILLEFGRPGVPLALIYPPRAGADPIVLPELLPSPSIVLEALDRAVSNDDS